MKLNNKLMIGAVAAVLSLTAFAGMSTNILTTVRTNAEKGNAAAMNILGDFYFNGEHVGKDYTEAIKWYKKAAEKGNVSAMCNLGICYQYGFGASINDENLALAIEWYKKAADQGYARAQYHLGNCYENQKIDDKIKDKAQRDALTAKHREQAFPWYKKAAENGYALAQYKLARYYEWKKNTEEAVKWYKRAAEQGIIHAQSQLIYLAKPIPKKASAK